MRWEDERYVRIYTRDTPEWISLGWEAQSLFILLLRKLDRAGVLELGKSGARGLAALLRMPQDVTERALAALIEDGCVEQRGSNLVVPNFIEAQESTMSPSVRQKESRERRRDLIRSGLDPNQRETVIYFIQSEHGGPVKIGRADDLAKRLQGLGTGRPDTLVLLGAVAGTVEDERRVHAALNVYREKGEWFSPSPMVMACARAAVTGATIEDVLRHAVTCHTGADSVTPTVTIRDGQHVASNVPSTVTPYRTVPYRTVPEIPPTPHGGNAPEGSPPFELVPAPAKRTRQRRAERPEQPIPKEWAPTDEHTALAAKEGVDMRREAQKFRFWAEGKTAASWNGRFATWLMKAGEDRRSRGEPPHAPCAPERPRVVVEPRRPPPRMSDEERQRRLLAAVGGSASHGPTEEIECPPQ